MRFEPLIPKIFHRTIPQNVGIEVHLWWEKLKEIHPTWEFMEHDEPLDPLDYPITGHLFDKCETGAQKADLLRLEVIWTYGGIYVDSDVQPYRRFDPLTYLPAFAAWEDKNVIPNAVFGAMPRHPAIEQTMIEAVHLVENGADTATSGIKLTTAIWSDRDDLLALPPDALYPHHYLQKRKAGVGQTQPWSFCEHMWHHSWGDEQTKLNIERNQQ